MFVCSLFREFRELNETMKLKGVNIDTVATSIGITRVGIVRLEFGKIKGAKIILHAKSSTFRAAKSKGFYSITGRPYVFVNMLYADFTLLGL